MITSDERSDLIHIMKINRLALIDSDSAHLSFGGQVKGKDYQINVLVVEDLPRLAIKKEGEILFNDTIKSIDDLKIFLEERLYKYFEV
jgi:hypothetical protein